MPSRDTQVGDTSMHAFFVCGTCVIIFYTKTKSERCVTPCTKKTVLWYGPSLSRRKELTVEELRTCVEQGPCRSGQASSRQERYAQVSRAVNQNCIAIAICGRQCSLHNILTMPAHSCYRTRRGPHNPHYALTPPCVTMRAVRPRSCPALLALTEF